MLLINWFTANMMMIGVVLVLVGIPVVIAITVFAGNKNKKEGNTE